MLELSAKNIDGKVATKIYEDLAENYKRDPQKEYRDKYISNGCVFCYAQNGSKYVPISDAHYLPKGQKYQNIINRYWLMDLAPRFTAERIEKLFGVKQLEFKILVKNFETSEINDKFNHRLALLKPYYYALKEANDEDNKLMQKIKGLKIIICSTLDAVFLNEQQEESFELYPYEWIHDNNQYYVFVGNDNINSSQLADKVAEIISDCFGEDVTSDKSKKHLYVRLFEKYESEKDLNYILEEEGYGLENIRSAKERMGISGDAKTIFWSNVLLTKDYAPLFDKNMREENLINIVQNKVGISIDDYDIDYEDIANDCNISELSRLFFQLDISLKEFNKHSNEELDFCKYYEKQWDNLRNNNEEKFEYCLYHSLIESNCEEQSKLFDKIEAYNKIKMPEQEVIDDIDRLFFKIIESKFGINIETCNETASLNDIYKDKMDSLKIVINDKPNPNSKLLEDIVKANKRFKSLVCFDDYKEILKEYEDNNKIDDNNIKQIRNNDEDSSSNTQHNIKDPITETARPLQKGTLPNGEKNLSRDKPTNPNSPKRDKETDNDEGADGEEKVYNYLVEKYGENNVKWVSKNAEKKGAISNGDDNLHYDMRYKDDNGNWIYIEVKATASSRKSFSLTKEETKFGKEKKDKYKIVHIINLYDNDKMKKYGFIPFAEKNFMQSDKFAVEIRYIFKYADEPEIINIE